MNITAKDIVDLLAIKHGRDVFVPECKTGPSVGGVPRLDAWAMNRSWAQHAATVYEIKVHRSDFLADKKWPNYLDYGHYFYWVCPPKVIAPREVPEGTGLLWTSVNAKRLYTKVKAPRRELEVPNELFVYVMMWRARITREYQAEDAADYWKQWLATKRENRELGHRVSRSMAKLVRERIDEVDTKNQWLAKQNERLAEAKKLCAELGVDISWTISADAIRQAQREKLGGDVLHQLREAKRVLERAEKEIAAEVAAPPTS